MSFAWRPQYLHCLVGVLTSIMCLTMLCVAVEAPKIITDRLENSKLGEQLFTFRGRYMVDLLIALFLFAMPIWGILLGLATLFSFLESASWASSSPMPSTKFFVNLTLKVQLIATLWRVNTTLPYLKGGK